MYVFHDLITSLVLFVYLTLDYEFIDYLNEFFRVFF